MEFRLFIEQHETYMKDVRKTLRKLPKSHRKLIRGYKFEFQPTNTLKGDCDHIGYVDENKKKIVVSAPWNYGREFTLLHEIGHAVWKYKMTEKLRNAWEKLFKQEKKQMKSQCQNAADSLNQNAEEIFCMVYASIYTKHTPTTYNNKKLIAFVKKI